MEAVGQLIQAMLSGLLQGGVYAMMASGLSMTLGVLRVVDLGYGMYYMLGAYLAVTMISQVGCPVWVAVALAPAGVFLLGLLFEHGFVRMAKHDELRVMIVTMAGAFAVEEAVRFIWGADRKDLPGLATGSLRAGQVLLSSQRVIAFLVAVAVLTALLAGLKHSRLGMAVRMVAQDRRAATILGINVNAVQRLTFATGAMLAALAGTLLSPLFVVYPSMGWDPLTRAFATVILGGIGSLGGTIVAGLLLGLVEVLTSVYVASALAQVAFFVVLVLVILFRPSGLYGVRLRRS
jgi:branched-chain amino acid transport system permease protein